MERLTQASNKGGVAFTFDLDITCEPSEAKKILRLAEKLKQYEDLGTVEELQQAKIKQIPNAWLNDDIEEKWVVAPEGVSFTKDEIMRQVAFQEQYFHTEIRM